MQAGDTCGSCSTVVSLPLGFLNYRGFPRKRGQQHSLLWTAVVSKLSAFVTGRQAGSCETRGLLSLSLVMDLVFSPLVHGFPTSQHSIWSTVGLSTESVGSPRPHARAHTVCACGWVVSCREPHSLLRQFFSPSREPRSSGNRTTMRQGMTVRRPGREDSCCLNSSFLAPPAHQYWFAQVPAQPHAGAAWDHSPYTCSWAWGGRQAA